MSKKPEQGRRPVGKVIKDIGLEILQGKKKEHQQSGIFFSSFWYITAVYLDNNHGARFLFRKARVICFSNLMNVQIRKFDDQRQKVHEFGKLSCRVYM